MTLPSATNDLAIAIIHSQFAETSGWTATSGVGQTTLFDQLPVTGNSIDGVGSSKPGASSVTLSYPVSGGPFATIVDGFSLKN